MKLDNPSAPTVSTRVLWRYKESKYCAGYDNDTGALMASIGVPRIHPLFDKPLSDPLVRPLCKIAELATAEEAVEIYDCERYWNFTFPIHEASDLDQLLWKINVELFAIELKVNGPRKVIFLDIPGYPTSREGLKTPLDAL